jgi:hypothetical protein
MFGLSVYSWLTEGSIDRYTDMPVPPIHPDMVFMVATIAFYQAAATRAMGTYQSVTNVSPMWLVRLLRALPALPARMRAAAGRLTWRHVKNAGWFFLFALCGVDLAYWIWPQVASLWP